MKNRLASQIALLAVIGVVGASFFWWFRHRPSYLLYQAHSGVGGETQAAAIAQYTRLLKSGALKPEDEIKYRMALGELYLRTIQESSGVSLVYAEDPTKPANPFIAQARAEFERVQKLDPGNAMAHFYVGRLLWLQNLEAFALKEFELAREKEPGNAEILRFLSLIHQERGDPAAGREFALQALAANPGSDDARMALIQAYALLGDHANSLKEHDLLSPAFREAPMVRARHALYLARQNHWPEAGQEIEAALNTAPQDGNVKVLYGQILLERGLVEEAAGVFAQAQALMPRSVWPLLWTANAEMRRGRCEGVTRTAQMLTGGLPRWPWAHLAAAWNSLCKGDHRRAISSLDEALRLSHDFPEATLLKAEILIDRGQFDELGRVIRPMLDEKVMEEAGHVLLAQSFLGQGQATLAIEMAEAAIRLNQRDHRAFAVLALARAAANDTAGAVRAFDNALRLNGFDTTLAAQAALFRGRAERGGEGESLLQGLAESDARNPMVWLCRGDLQLFTGQFSDAAASYDTALALRPWLLKAHLGKAEADFRLGKIPSAEGALAAAMFLNPRSPEINALRARLRRS